MKKLAIGVIGVFALLSAGCVVVVGTDTEDGVYFAGEHNEEGGIRHDGDTLSRDVARAIAADADLVAEDIRVSSEDGVVVLKGRVHGTDQLERAMTIAKGVERVDRVVSKLTVDTV